jgi:thiamine-monophosphate kinase
MPGMSEVRGELALVEHFRREAGRDPARVPIGIGDDMAGVRLDGGLILLTCDMLLDGTHFDTGTQPLPQIGRKVLACSLSDCAAMAARPVAAVVSVGLNEQMSQRDAEELFAGMKQIADEFGCPIVGGDTNSWPHPLAIDVSIVALPATARGPVLRNGAKADDAVYVTGSLGGSLRRRHLSFTPRIREATLLAGALGEGLHAMMDLSDGLALDLYRLCKESRVGALLEEDRLEAVISADARDVAAADGRSPLEHALHDGEDFELLVVVEPSVSLPDLGILCTRVGCIVPDGLTLRTTDGREMPLEPRGFEHFK